MRHKGITITAATAVILGVTSLSPAFGETRQPAAVEQPTAAPVSDAAAEAIDAAHIAEQTGRPFEEVRAEQHRDVLFGQALASLQGVDGFANAGKDATGPGYWVAFTAPVPADALAPLGELAPDVRTTTDAPLTAEAVLLDASASASVDGDLAAAAQAGTDQAEAAVAQAATVPVEVALTDDDVSQEVLSGGTALGIGNTQQLACTAGFTVRNARTGATGLITASHCPDNLNYESRQILTFEGHGDSGQLDEQWFSSSESVHNEFISQKAGSTLIRRKATAVAAPFVGMNVCKYGTVTAYGCSQVINGPTTTVNANGVTYANLWQVDGYITDAGDSGGPWYYGNTAYGIHYGDIPRGGADRSAFTSITAIEAATDLRVLR
jgi:streptogrisin C